MSRSIILLSIAVTSPLDIVYGQRILIGLYRLYLTVSHVNDTVRTLCNICIMGNKNDGISMLGRKLLQQVYDQLSRFRIKCARRLIAEDYLRIFGKSSCNRYSLLLTA